MTRNHFFLSKKFHAKGKVILTFPLVVAPAFTGARLFTESPEPQYKNLIPKIPKNYLEEWLTAES